MACNEGMKLITSKKQTIIQGIQTANPYTNYLFEITLDDTVDVTIDSILIFDSNRCMKVNHYVTKSSTNNQLSLNAAIKEGNYTLLKKYKSSTEKVMIYYKLNNKKGKLKITSFEEETITRR